MPPDAGSLPDPVVSASADVAGLRGSRRRLAGSGTSPRSREGAVLGRSCVVGRGAYVGPGVRVGDNVKIQNYALVYEPAELGVRRVRRARPRC